ncbi:PKD-like domain-containing protein, partial [Alistipes sp.]|uniref:PKD-like domain-containing protein n=1 Tax=Alistipes sp. TaxID=1872444 RepID=UPI00307E7A73
MSCFFSHAGRTAIPVLLSVLLAAAACNKDGEITLPDSKPRITLDSETGVYAAKIGRTVTITPTVENEGDAAYSWTIDDEVVSTERVFEHAFSEEGRVYVTLRVENRAGYDEKEARIDVNRLAPPIISLIVPPTGLYVLTGREYTFAPEVQNGENARYEWYLDDSSVPVSTQKDYIFMRTRPGDCTLRLTAANEDGTAEKTLAVHVVDVIPVRIAFIPSSYSADPLVRSVSLGRTLFLRPQVADAVGPEYTWYVDGTLQEGATDRMFAFTPEKEGEYEVTFRVTDTDESPLAPLSRHITRASSKRITEETLRVTCYERESERVITTTGQPAADRVLEFLPAPGQFVNEKDMAGYTGQKTFEEARLYAENRLKKGEFVSLGNFGGYVILAFDHSVENKGGYDFSIPGNQFEGSNEPGVVWVMQDVNGNGKPDDEWYELR